MDAPLRKGMCNGTAIRKKENDMNNYATEVPLLVDKTLRRLNAIVKGNLSTDNPEARSVGDILRSIISGLHMPAILNRFADAERLAVLLPEADIRNEPDNAFTVRMEHASFRFQEATQWNGQKMGYHKLAINNIENGYTSLPNSEEDIADYLLALDSVMERLTAEVRDKMSFLNKKKMLLSVNSMISKTALEEALDGKGYPYIIEYKDARALVKVKVCKTRMVVLNVLYKNLDKEIPELLEAIDTLKGIIDKFGKYTFIASCKGMDWPGEKSENTDQTEQDIPFPSTPDEMTPGSIDLPF